MQTMPSDPMMQAMPDTEGLTSEGEWSELNLFFQGRRYGAISHSSHAISCLLSPVSWVSVFGDLLSCQSSMVHGGSSNLHFESVAWCPRFDKNIEVLPKTSQIIKQYIPEVQCMYAGPHAWAGLPCSALARH